MLISGDDVTALERGVSLFASGGGGGTAWAATLLRARLSAGGSVSLVSVADLPRDAEVVPVGGLGAAAMVSERPPAGGELAAVVAAISRWCGCSADVLMSSQVGGLNGIMPYVNGLELGFPWVDADLAGRGLARLDRLSVVASGRGLAPLAIGTSSGHMALLTSGSATEIERSARSVVAAAGGWGVYAMAPIRAHELAKCAVLGSVSEAIRLGREAVATGGPPDAYRIASAAGGRVLGMGRVAEVGPRLGPVMADTAGFARGSVVIKEHSSQSLVRLEMENEYILALIDGQVVASTPDVICVVDRRTGATISCDSVRIGIEVAVLQLPAPEFWADPARSWVIEPASYGLATDPVVLR